MADNRIRILATLDDKVSSGLAKIHDRFDTLGKSKGFQSIISGVGLGIGVGLWKQATGSIVGFIGDAVAAAREEELSIQKLGTALKANVPAWDGQTDAIERVLRARMDLGFSDEEQRDSLARLVAATHDISQALDIERTAMDLARFKGISLSDATDALTRVEAGSYRVLKSLGIQLKEGATQTEALAAVQRVAAGQAEDYADTTDGKLLVAQVKINEAMEKFGLTILPVVAEGATAVATDVTTLADVIGLLTGQTKLTSEEQANLGLQLLDLAASLPMVGMGFDVLNKAQHDQVAAAMAAQEAYSNEAAGAHSSFTEMNKAGNDAFAALKTGSDDWRTQFEDDSGAIIRSSEKVRRQMSKDAQDIIDSVFGPLETRADAEAAHFQLAADKKILANAKGVKAQHEAKAAIVKDLDDQASALVDLSKTGDLTADDVENFAKDARSAYGSMSAESKAKINGVIDRLRALVKFDGRDVKLGVILKWKSINDTHGPGRGNLEFAEGGRVPGRKGQPQLAVVHGGEFVVSNEMQDQMRLGSSLTIGASAPVGGGLTVNFNSVWPPTRQQAAEIARVVDEAQHGTLRRAAPTGAQGI